MANYVTSEVITLAGTVSESRWSNLHTWLFMSPHRRESRSGILRDVVREDGEVLVIERP